MIRKAFIQSEKDFRSFSTVLNIDEYNFFFIVHRLSAHSCCICLFVSLSKTETVYTQASV